MSRIDHASPDEKREKTRSPLAFSDQLVQETPAIAGTFISYLQYAD